ncbi:hypothetical protein [Fusobacterium polymorphum]|uniref:hypothetical protein n=1 Tax=Fusobacterium nucleatum subsp. polymorphum TaxID=76857 RepID=UPI0030D0B182
MWKCKKCGCLNFRKAISGYVDVDFDKDEEEEIYEDTLEITNEEYIECCKCGNNSNYIQNIADWEEEDERD